MTMEKFSEVCIGEKTLLPFDSNHFDVCFFHFSSTVYIEIFGCGWGE